ncbi:MAG: hypothetical protein CL534_19065 [Ahrensia sp.]|nr:hypothetical protein [Ahrensia sp.]
MYTLRRIFALTAVLLWALGTSASTGQAAPIGPSYPPPGDVTFNDNGVSAASGTAVWEFTNFDTSGLSELYFGLIQTNPTWGPAGAGLTGTALPFVFDNINGTEATWNVTSDWANPDNNNTVEQVDLRMVLDVTGLGANPWITDLASIGLDDTGAYGILGAVVDNTAGLDMTLTWKIQAFVGGSWIAINDVKQPQGSFEQTRSSAAPYGFFSVAAVPVPPAIFLLGSALFGLGLIGRRKLA